jgi:hypothetical protein
MTVTLSPKESSPYLYNLHRTKAFVKSFCKLDSNVQKMLDRTIRDVLLVAPFETKCWFPPNSKAKEAYGEGISGYFLQFAESVGELGLVRLNNCIDCRNREENDIMLFACGHRKNVYDE